MSWLQPLRTLALSAAVGFSMGAFGGCDKDKGEQPKQDSPGEPPTHRGAPSQKRPPKNDTAHQKRKAAPPDPSPDALPTHEVHVLERGKEPHKKLRYLFGEGRTKDFSMRMKLRMQATTDETPSPTIPPMVFRFSGTTTTRQVTQDKSALRETTFSEFRPIHQGIPAPMATQLEQDLESFEGMRMVETITNRGQIQEVEVKDEAMVSQHAKMFLRNVIEGISNTFLPLPEEPVGTGARWEGRTRIVASGVTVVQKGEFHLKSIDESQINVDMKFHQKAPSQEVKAPQVDPTLKTELVRLEGRGNGVTVIDLKTLDTHGQVSTQTETVTKVTSQSAPQKGGKELIPEQARTVTSKVTMQVDVTMTLE